MAGQARPLKRLCPGANYELRLLRLDSVAPAFTTLTLLENGYDVVIVDNLYNSSQVVIDRIEKICGRRAHLYQVDVTDEKALDDVFAKHPAIDSVIHFAALKVCKLVQHVPGIDLQLGDSTD